MISRIVSFFLFFFLASGVPLYSMQKELANKENILVPSLKIALDNAHIEVSLKNALNHVCQFHKTVESGKERISGFHYYGNKSFETMPYNEGTLVKFSPHLWMYCEGSIKNFHQGYIIHQGTLYKEPKTFFPSQWNVNDIIHCMQQLKDFTIVADRSVAKACRKLTVKAHSTDLSHPSFVLALNIYPALGNATNLVTFFPYIQQSKKLGTFLEALALRQIKEMEDIKGKKGTLNREPQLFKELQEGNSAKFMKLLAHHADPNSVDSEGRTPLMLALKKGTVDNPGALEMVNALLENGADKSLVDNKGNSILHYALQSENYFMVLAALDSQLVSKANKDGITPLMEAVKRKLLDIVYLLASQGIDSINAQDRVAQNTALMYACHDLSNKCGQPDAPQLAQVIVSLLLSFKADPDIQNIEKNTALHYAASSQCLKRVQTLLRAHADYTIENQRGQTPLRIAESLANKKIIDFLCAQQQEKIKWIEENQANALIRACFEGDIKTAKKQLKKCDINAVTIDGVTALYYAIQGGHKELVELLLDNNADVNFMIGSMTIAQYAQDDSISLPEALKKKLLERAQTVEAHKQAKIQAQRAESIKARQLLGKQLREAVLADSLSLTLLVELEEAKNCVVNTQGDTLASTLLFYAINNGKYNAVRQILNISGNHRNAVNHDGDSVVLVAAKKNDLTLVELLCKHEVIINDTTERIACNAIKQCVQFACENRRIDILSILLHERRDALLSALQHLLRDVSCDSSIAYARYILTALPLFSTALPSARAEAEALFFSTLEAQSVEGLKLLIEKAPFLLTARDAQGRTALMRACQLDSTALVNILLSEDIDSTIETADGGKALDYVSPKSNLFNALKTHYQKCSESKNQQIQIERKEKKIAELKMQGYTPLMIAAYFNDIETIRDSQESGFEKTTEGRTALMIAAEQGHSQAIQLLAMRDIPDQHMTADSVNKESLINLKDNDGYTALLLALLHGQCPAAEELLALRASVLCHAQGKSAYSIVNSKYRMEKVFSLLKKALALELPLFARSILASNKPTEQFKNELPLVQALDESHKWYLINQWVSEDRVDLVELTVKLLPSKSAEDIRCWLPILNEAQSKNCKQTTLCIIRQLCSHVERLKYWINQDETLATQLLSICAKHSNTPFAQISEISLDLLNTVLDTENDELIYQFFDVINPDVKIIKKHPWEPKELIGTPLIIELTNQGFEDGIAHILERGVLIDATDHDGSTALIISCLDSEVELSLVELLLENNADPNIVDLAGDNALTVACAINSLEKIQALLRCPRLIMSSIHDEFYNPIISACRAENEEIALALLNDARISVLRFDADCSYILNAAAAGKVRMAILLLEKGCSANAAHQHSPDKGKTALHEAVSAKSGPLVVLLLKHGADINAVIEDGDQEGMTPLHLAAMNGDIPIIQILLQRGANRDIPCATGKFRGYTALSLASAYGHTEAAKWLRGDR